jgi:hypothetical protein
VTELALLEAVPLAHAAVARAAADHDVRVLFFKGPVATIQGLRAERDSQDVDALVDPARLAVLTSALTELGWVDEHLYTTPTAATYSRTHRHAAWPCELDLHTRFPGLFAPEQDVFDVLWARRESVEVASQEVPCPDPQAHAVLLALNSLRDPKETTKIAQLAELVRRVSSSFDARALQGLGGLARDLGAADTAAPFLSAVGAPNDGLGTTSSADLHAWRLRTQPGWRVATWMEGLRDQPLRSWPRYLWYAAMLSETELRQAHPDLPPGRRALLRVRVQRLRRGARALPAALASVRESGTGPQTGVTQPEVVTATTWRSRRMPALLTGGASAALGLLDRALVRKRGVLIRTFPDFDDQGLELARALADAGVEHLVWLVKSSEPPGAAVADRLPPGTRLVDAGSLGGALAYAKARVVVHTHGLYGIPARSGRKLFVNLWHGWGTKQLQARPPVAARQSDVVTVLSGPGADAVASAWGLDRDRVRVTGLPRNDVMMRASREPRPRALQDAVPDGRPVVVWLPTYRRSVVGELRTDGVEFDNDFQLPGCRRPDVEALAHDLGVHIVLKTHPMAVVHEPGERDGLTVWDDPALAATGMSLYELLGHADVLITDYSSVWVDFLLLDRPIVFAAADREEYGASRGHYAGPTEGPQLPGPEVRDLAELRPALREALRGDDPWATSRRAIRAEQHAWTDSGSAARVADLITAHLARSRDRTLDDPRP